MVEAGFDGRAYDFGSALHEALTSSLCAVRWMRREPAFPDSCREEGLEDDDDDESGVTPRRGLFSVKGSALPLLAVPR